MSVKLGDIVDKIVDGYLVKDDWWWFLLEFSNKAHLTKFYFGDMILTYQEIFNYLNNDKDKMSIQNKKNRIITKIEFVDKKSDIIFSNIKEMKIKILNGFNFPCHYVVHLGRDHAKVVLADIIKDWNKFEDDDLITICGELTTTKGN